MTAPARVVLVGAGHAHLHVAARTRELTALGATVTLVDPGTFWYSGRATAVLGGRCAPAADCLDPDAIVTAAGGHYVADRVIAIDRDARQLQLAGGGTLEYDWLSLNVGSEVDSKLIARDDGDMTTFPVKPIANLWRLSQAVETRLNNGETPRIVVVGGGPTGCEVAINLAALVRHHGGRAELCLVQRQTRVAPSLPPGAGRRLHAQLERRGVRVVTASGVTEHTAGALMLDDGRRLPADIVVLATGLAAPAWLDELDLPADDGLCVDATLRSIADPRIFAAGDCARVVGHTLPRLGVFGVRQAPVLLANLAATLENRPLQHYEPQSRWLSILDLGDGTGLATRGRRWWHGRASHWLKTRLDRRFLASYRACQR